MSCVLSFTSVICPTRAHLKTLKPMIKSTFYWIIIPHYSISYQNLSVLSQEENMSSFLLLLMFLIVWLEAVRQLKIGIILWLTNCQYLWVPMYKYFLVFHLWNQSAGPNVNTDWPYAVIFSDYLCCAATYELKLYKYTLSNIIYILLRILKKGFLWAALTFKLNKAEKKLVAWFGILLWMHF
jgi:hypothetical protein